jgi:glutamyl-tRNA reductase
MTLIALGLNHQTAPVALRERVSFDRETVPPALAALRAVDGVEEVAIVSTCNRIELYANVREGRETAVVEWLHSHHGLTPPTLEEFLYRHDGPAAVRHLFRVATGLDSLVLGEPQILGQVKEAYHLARTAGSLGSPLDRLFQNTFAVAKRVRTDTRIGANPVSVAFAAVRLAHQVFADLGKSTVLLVGAGDTIELAARHLVDTGIQRMLVANRTLANAEALASRFGAQALSLSEIPQRLAEADVVIASTASREPILTREQVAAAIRARRRKPMLILDLAVPRDVEAATAELEHVFLYTVDDLAGVIEENMRSRREAAREAEAIIDLQVGHFMDWCRGIDGQGLVRNLRAQAEHERDAVLARARQMVAAGKPADEALAFLANTLTNKILHAPSANLRAAALRGDTDMLRAAERLYAEAADPRPTRAE